MIFGFTSLFTFFFLAGLLIDEEGARWDFFQGVFWFIILLAVCLTLSG